MVSDMLIQPVSGAPVTWKDWGIKVVIPYPQLCVGCAGGDLHADQAIYRLKQETATWAQAEQVIDLFLHYHKASLRDPDKCPTSFLLAFGDSLKPITTIRSGIVQQHGDFGWIGSQRAFNRFQKARASHRGEEQTLTKAMQEVIDDPVIDEVGGMPYQVVHSREHPESQDPASFHYPVRYHNKKPATERSDNDGKISWTAGPSSSGSYSIFVMRATKHDGERNAALYFPQGGFGIYYSPQKGGILRPEVIPDSEDKDFAQILRDRHGAELFCWPGRKGYRISANVEYSGSMLPIAPRIVRVALEPPPVDSKPPDGPIVRGDLICNCCGHSKGSPLEFAERFVQKRIVENDNELTRLCAGSENAGTIGCTLSLDIGRTYRLRFGCLEHPLKRLVIAVQLWQPKP